MGLPAHIEDVLDDLTARYALPLDARAEIARIVDRVLTPQLNAPSTVTGIAEEESSVDPAFSRTISAGSRLGDFSRLEDRGDIGAGGTSLVKRVFDPDLGRAVAAKLLRVDLLGRPGHVERFLQEARMVAQLDHPGIVPIHEIGRLSSGQPYFTMREIHGQTLAHIIREVHHASSPDGWKRSPSGWTLHRLVEAFRRVCETVAYAHSRGVIHRDLKPSNIMVGKFGEVYTLDFGVAKLIPPEEEALGNDDPKAMAGTITGTPAYMSPEQARGEKSAVGRVSDVYSLGAMLYEILAGRPPYDASTPIEILRKVRTEEPLLPAEVALASGHSPPVPHDLQSICLRAMAREPAERLPDADTLAAEVAAWLEGMQKRESALRLVAEADEQLAHAVELRERAARMRQEAEQTLVRFPPFAPAELKEAGWALEDEAAHLETLAETKETECTQHLRSALGYSPDLSEAHARLGDYFRAQHADAEQSRRSSDAARFDVLLRSHEHGRHAAYLKRTGSLSLCTDPEGATVDLYRYEERGRRLVEEFVRPLGRTPLKDIELPIGSYLLVVRLEGHETVRCPVHIERLVHWDGVGPASSRPVPIPLPRTGALAPGDIYVPAGWFSSGGDHEAINGLRRQRLWLDGFVIRRFPVTNGEYVAFLNDLVASGREEEAMKWVPRERAGAPGEIGPMLCERDESGRFSLRATAAHVPLQPDLPVCMVDWSCAKAYADWRAQGDDLAWRLPGEMEWEKAARGVDGRAYPWGSFLDPSWCLMRLSHSEMGKAFMNPVDSFEHDRSPYGVRGMAGNARDWCFDAYQPLGPRVVDGRPILSNGEDVQGPGAMGAHRVYKGGTWREGDRSCRAAFRDAPPAYFRDWDISFRILRPL